MNKSYIEHKYGKNLGLSKRDKRRLALEIEEYEFKNLSIAEQKELSDYITKARIFPEPNWQEEIKKGICAELLIGIKAIYAYSPAKISKVSDSMLHRFYFEKLKHFYESALIFSLKHDEKSECLESLFQDFWKNYHTAYPENFAILTDYYNLRNTKYENGNLILGTDFITTLSEKIPVLVEILKDTTIWIHCPKLPFFRHYISFHKEENPIQYIWQRQQIIKKFDNVNELLKNFQSVYSSLITEKTTKKQIKPKLKKEYGRHGEDYRQGRNISVEEFQYTFAFKGLEFGEALSQAERQKAVNRAYDAFMDLAKLLEVETFLIAHGELSFCYASRGAGRAAACYSPSHRLINLTRDNGWHAIAHEVGHFYDDVIGSFLMEHPKQREGDLRYDLEKSKEINLSSLMRNLKFREEKVVTKHSLHALIKALLPWVKNPKLKNMLLKTLQIKGSDALLEQEEFLQVFYSCFRYLPNEQYKKQFEIMLSKFKEKGFEYTTAKSIWVENDYYKAAYAMNEQNRLLKHDEEMFARAFETYISTLFSAPNHNDFLVSEITCPPNKEDLEVIAPTIEKYLGKYFDYISSTQSYQILQAKNRELLEVIRK